MWAHINTPRVRERTRPHNWPANVLAAPSPGAGTHTHNADPLFNRAVSAGLITVCVQVAYTTLIHTETPGCLVLQVSFSLTRSPNPLPLSLSASILLWV